MAEVIKRSIGGATKGGLEPLGERLLEREHELGALRAVTDSAARGNGAVALVEGTAGIGKSVLLASARELARERGFQVLAAGAGELDTELPWSVVRDLLVPALERAPKSRRERLLDGAAGLAEPLLGPGSGDAGGGAEALAGYLHGLYWLVANITEEGPVALVVDDAHWADPLSLRALAYLAARAVDLPLALIVASRPPIEARTAELLRAVASRARFVRPTPLSAAGARSLLDAVMGSSADDEFARACHQATGGNPFLLSELAVALRRDGLAPRGDAVRAVEAATPETISRAVLLRLSPLPEPARELARAVAVLGSEGDLAIAAAVAGVSAAVAADAAAELTEADVLAPELPPRFVHPLVRSVIYADTAPARRARAHARAAEALRAARLPAPSIAVHLHAVEPGTVEDAVAVLREAGAEALARGAPAAAAADLRRALDEPIDPEHRAAILIELADAEAAAGEPEAMARLEQALPLLPRGRDRALLFKRLGSMLYGAGRFSEAEQAFGRGLEVLGDDDDELATELRGGRLTISTMVAGGHDAESTLRALGGPPDSDPKRLSDAEREVLTQLSLARIFRAESHDDARALARRALGDGAMLAAQGISLSFSVAVSCVTWCDDFEHAGREIERALEHAGRRGALLEAAYVLFGRSQVGYWCGCLSEAAADAGAAVEAWSGAWTLQLPAAMCWRVMCLVELDELDAASATLRFPPELEVRELLPMEEATLAFARGRIALGHGDFAAALTTAEPLIRALDDRPPFFQSCAYLPWRSDAATAAARLGARDQAIALAEEELELARSFGAARPLGIALRGAGLAAGGAEGIELLRQSVSTLEHSPTRIELCRSLVELGGALRRSGNRAEARDRLDAGVALARRHEARALERRAVAELGTSGARRPKRELSGPESLTPSERRVAELAAAGTTNREIAQQLFVSLRTVETHLTHAYAKLEIGSRRELRDALQPAAPG